MVRNKASPDQLELALGLVQPPHPVPAGKGAGWAVPEFSNTRVDKAGRLLAAEDASDQALDEALLIINNWRSSHSFPLNTFQVGLRYRSRQVDERALLAQRIKRQGAFLD